MIFFSFFLLDDTKNDFMKKYYLPISGTKSVAHKVAVIVIVVIQKLGRPMCIVPFTSKVVVQFDEKNFFFLSGNGYIVLFIYYYFQA